MPFDVIVGRDKGDIEKFQKRGLAFIGKTYVKMGQYVSLSNPIYLDVARSHVVLISGKRGSGKSYTIGAIAESLSDLKKEDSVNISSLIFDTMGIFWTMKFKNEKDKNLLQQWGLEPKKTPVELYVPKGKVKEYELAGITADREFSIKISSLEPSDWINLFRLNFTDNIAVLITLSIENLKKNSVNFGFLEIEQEIEKNDKFSIDSKNSAKALFNAAKEWGIFSKDEDYSIKDIVSPGKTSVIDVSTYSSIGAFNIRALVIGIVSRKLFEERQKVRKIEEIEAIQHGGRKTFASQKEKIPIVWIFIDEAHEFLPEGEKTPATDALVQILREGRQPGISLVLATQQPGKIHTDVMSQSDIILSHRVTSKSDVEALNSISQSYLYSAISEQMNSLPKLKGSAIILDDNSERIYPIRVRPRFTWHGGEAPTAIKED